MKKKIDPDDKSQVLKRFMLEMFDFSTLKKQGFYGQDIKRNDYEGQAKRVCEFFGYKTVYEYGAKEIRCHITFAGKRPDDEGFVTTIESIYE